MKILIDTNILISALLFPKSKPSKALLYVSHHHTMVLCNQNIYELKEVLKRKAPHTLQNAEMLLNSLSYELIPTVYGSPKSIRDKKDQPILDSAIAADVDIIITGDKDFLSLDISSPKCMTAAEFLSFENVAI